MQKSLKNELEIDSFGRQGQRILRIYHIYRIVIALIIILLVNSDLKIELLRTQNLALLDYSAWSYLIINGALTYYLFRPKNSFATFILGLLDISLLIVMFYAAGGISSGIANLILIAVSINNILLRGRIGILLAAIAAIGIIYLTFYISLSEPELSNQFVQAGTVGALCFASAFFIQTITRRIQATENLAISHASEAASLEALNNLILQRMHTGIVVIDQKHRIVLANASAQKMFNCEDLQGRLLDPHSQALIERLQQWRSNPAQRTPPFKIRDGAASLQASFLEQYYKAKRQIIIFLDDTTQMVQQAQHLKLASLGRLTASIAHEIRNPLGAIGHAAQLLSESEELEKYDLRLTQIIQDNTRRMNSIIENILQLSRQRRAEPELVNLAEYIQDFADRFTEVAQFDMRLHVDIATDEGIILESRIDPQQIEQVLDNLVTNGIRHSQNVHGLGQVWLKLYRKEDTLQPILDVVDDGEGIRFGYQSQIFEPFFTTENKGTGLGLYISAQLCESNAARLDYIDRDEKGACFRITFSLPHTA